MSFCLYNCKRHFFVTNRRRRNKTESNSWLICVFLKSLMENDDAHTHTQHPVNCWWLKIGLQGGVHHRLASDLNHVIVEEGERRALAARRRRRSNKKMNKWMRGVGLSFLFPPFFDLPRIMIHSQLLLATVHCAQYTRTTRRPWDNETNVFI